jgi:hypothetical protein
VTAFLQKCKGIYFFQKKNVFLIFLNYFNIFVIFNIHFIIFFQNLSSPFSLFFLFVI